MGGSADRRIGCCSVCPRVTVIPVHGRIFALSVRLDEYSVEGSVHLEAIVVGFKPFCQPIDNARFRVEPDFRLLLVVHIHY